ncbi:MAG TPA: hypothetical protein VIK35_08745 [Verrucomicrobiae bacterium]
MSQAQLRAKSGLAFVTNEIGDAEENWETAASGKTQATTLPARSESWFWLAVGAGTAGEGCESDTGFAAQHGILTPCWQHAGTGDFARHALDGVCADRKGIPASMRLQIMAAASFIG